MCVGTSNTQQCLLCVSNFFNSNFTVVCLHLTPCSPQRPDFGIFWGFREFGVFVVHCTLKKTKEQQTDPNRIHGNWYNSYDNVKACFNSNWNTDFLGMI